MFFVYVLRSQTTGRFYTGQTSSIPQRLQKHEQRPQPVHERTRFLGAGSPGAVRNPRRSDASGTRIEDWQRAG
ncbi:MAG: hypothetical protein DMG88_02715 [Acidobacteria bacterium]|nr:MAG: hypothetical protein DMG88_02715 [Acidobacteriota bacterium]